MKKIDRLIDKAGCGLLVFFLLFSACSPDFDTGPDFGQGGCSGCGGSFSNTIYIMGYGFAPDSMSVQKGQMVTWHNTDTIPHSLICTDFSGFFIADLPAGGEYRYTAYSLGHFRYRYDKHGESGELNVIP
ncbi:hypothetical protein [Terrimonas alba]|uniref:hypothetical protein n=1 Tax=Terrimonas alba TaxID=3349636 RepID=UPI0035F4D0C5